MLAGFGQQAQSIMTPEKMKTKKMSPKIACLSFLKFPGGNRGKQNPNKAQESSWVEGTELRIQEGQNG